MTDRVALYLALILAFCMGADLVLTGGQTMIFVARRFVALIDWFIFWR